MDTATVALQVRDALDSIVAAICALCAPSWLTCGPPPRHPDGRTHPPAAGAAGDLRLQGGDLAVDRSTATIERVDQLRLRGSCSVEFAGAAGTLALAGREGPRHAASCSADELGLRRAGDHLARGARRLRRSRNAAGRWSPASLGKIATRRDDDGRPASSARCPSRSSPGRGRHPRPCRRSATRSRSELMLAAAEGGAPARWAAMLDGDGPGFRARHRPVARWSGCRHAGKFPADRVVAGQTRNSCWPASMVARASACAQPRSSPVA